MKKLICAALAAVMATSTLALSVSAEEKQLRFADDGEFTILQIADTQDDVYPAYELKDFIERAIELSDPDLVVFTGDTVEDSRIADGCVDAQGWREGVKVRNNSTKTFENCKVACDAVFSIVNDKGIPFAVTQGNNDYKCIENPRWLEIYSRYENCLVKDESDDKGGTDDRYSRIDYSLPILSSTGDDILFNLYMLDNGRGDPRPDQLGWYIETSNAIAEKAGHTVPAFAFEHRPVAEIGNLFTECKPWDKGAIVNGFRWYKLGDNAYGHADEVYTPLGESEQFKLWKQQGDVIGAYFGHVHTDGYTGLYDGIELGLTYGAEFAKAGPYGVRVLTLHEGDIMNYDNDLYTYSDGTFTKQEGNDVALSLGLRILVFFRHAFSGLFG